MTPAELHKLGKKLYGDNWQTALARALQVNPRTVRRWAAGDTEIPGPVEVAVRALAAARVD